MGVHVTHRRSRRRRTRSKRSVDDQTCGTVDGAGCSGVRFIRVGEHHSKRLGWVVCRTRYLGLLDREGGWRGRRDRLKKGGEAVSV